MKLSSLFFLPIIALMITSCSSVRVTTDYDTEADFNSYKTFAFYKKGIDKAAISDLDKKRIMRAIEQELIAKGMAKSASPDVLVSLFTKSRERINVNDRMYGGFYYPYYYGMNGLNNMNRINVSQYTEGTLFIDVLDAQNKALVWQGIGTGALSSRSVERKQARIKEFVKDILAEYPLENSKK
ncbi:DUF4136 domain-containing protein [Tenacibaculum finnmarkense]|uniref:DUF4136 domain-containing protein n=1 Tax=Tenacibaculum finnmarkense TaxID=2781243 RepID=UPI001E5F864A|nr:DUF4136 domain-containing protein [Tenacibaculum finnmarkense]MCD8418051.1 DUF4136 domain-containing protein [Tenacibaculum finnmarkense genomovar finnmarkense]MCG8185124.1 DUF4136 domain-containing protein [Tenacibaculum finnmarkense genomovar finnmarkense]MCG8201043.1 DUF4136 domain-containing protein [Tenacibaculum finnmarkense genomovar finnmarkense]MCG8209083.1 DUF4136 domain-containing protein [Tenacibaculum finnmarkense genomovar finnmarkense]MCG8224654.1 DUF4136 domain-containing pr